MYHPRTVRFVDWERFLENKDINVIFTLDFHIDAGFSFTNAVAFREMKATGKSVAIDDLEIPCLLYTSPSPRDATLSRMPSSA